MDQVWKGLSNLDPHDPGGFYKKPPLSHWYYEDNTPILNTTKWKSAQMTTVLPNDRTPSCLELMFNLGWIIIIIIY